eukprot:jgi/Chlat1/8474/Chrsp80S07871
MGGGGGGGDVQREARRLRREKAVAGGGGLMEEGAGTAPPGGQAAAAASSAPPEPVEWPGTKRLTRQWVEDFAKRLLDASWRPPQELPRVLHPSTLSDILVNAARVLAVEPTVIDVHVDHPDVRVVVVGDLHGQASQLCACVNSIVQRACLLLSLGCVLQYADVLRLLELAGPPEAKRQMFVFNGDYVDRGAWGLETYTILLCYKLLHPKEVYMLRGNHETAYCSSVYGFKGELEAKYGAQANGLFRKFLKCFASHPLAAVIAKTVFVAHGGLFRKPLPHQKKKGRLRRKRTTYADSSLGPLAVGTIAELRRAGKGGLDPTGEGNSTLASDVLWSDPTQRNSLQFNDQRGLGLLYGPDSTQRFLQENGLRLVIRSHEGPDARDKRSDMGPMDVGYTIDHSVQAGQLITVFSAPDYPQFQESEDRYNNRAAYAILTGPDYAVPRIEQFSAVLPRPKVKPYYDFVNVADSDDELNFEAMASGSEAEEGATGTLLE